MAHLEKLTKGAINGIIMHVERKVQNHSNKEIDITKTNLNYSLLDDNSNAIDRLKKRLDEVYMLNRKNVNAACSWVISLPAELIKRTEQEKKIFFKEVNDFLTERYGGKKNVIFSEVHNDETTPHLHFAFIPVVYDEKKDREKVSAKDVVDRKELKVFHNELDSHLKFKIPGIYQSGILNDKTIPLGNVKEIKLNKVIIGEIEQKAALLNQSLAPLRNEYNAKRNYIDSMNVKDVPDMYADTVKQSRSLFGKDTVTLPKDDYEALFTSAYEKRTFSEVKNRFDKHMQSYQKTDFWEDYNSLRKENYDLKKHSQYLEKVIEDTTHKVEGFKLVEQIYIAAKPFINKNFDKIMKVAENFPFARDFMQGFIAASYKTGDFSKSLEIGVHSNNYDFVETKEKYNLISRFDELEIINVPKRNISHSL